MNFWIIELLIINEDILLMSLVGGVEKPGESFRIIGHNSTNSF